MNKVWEKALKIISSIDIDLTKSYQLQRTVMKVLHTPHPRYKNRRVDTELILPDRKIPLRVFFPMGPMKNEMFLFFHGGGWVTGTIDTYDATCCLMANELKRIVVSVDYRLAPEHPYPDPLNDCYEVANAFFNEKFFLGIPPQAITLIGDSAGGNLAAAVSLMARDKKSFYPTHQILVYPATYHDHSMNSPFLSVEEKGKDYVLTAKHVEEYMELYVPDPLERHSPYVAPLLARDLSHQPKTLILTAEHDPLRDEGEAYGYRLQDYGNEMEIHRLPDTIHGFFTSPIVTKTLKQSYHYIEEFLKESDEDATTSEE